jgi:hypothetical protein
MICYRLAAEVLLNVPPDRLGRFRQYLGLFNPIRRLYEPGMELALAIVAVLNHASHFVFRSHMASEESSVGSIRTGRQVVLVESATLYIRLRCNNRRLCLGGGRSSQGRSHYQG